MSIRSPSLPAGGARAVLPGLAALACCLAAGCLGPWAIRGTRLQYNESYEHTASQEILLNIVRMRYGEGPTFMDLPTITSQTDATIGGAGAQASALNGTFGGNFNLHDDPTLTYTPRSGNNLLVSLLKAPKAETLLDIGAGNDSRIFLLAFVDAVNGIGNSSTATSPASRVIESNDEYRYVIDLFMGIQNRGAARLRVASRTVPVKGTPIPAKDLVADNLLAASANDYSFAIQGDQAVLFKTSKLMAMTFQTEDLAAPDVQEFIQRLRLDPGRTAYRIRSQDDANVDYDAIVTSLEEPIGEPMAAESIDMPPPSDPAADADLLPAPVVEEGVVESTSGSTESSDSVVLEMRTGYQVMAFLSKGVDVPAVHVRRGTAPTFKALDGRPFDARQLTRGFFHVCVQKHRPLHCDLAIHYRGHWFYIPTDDVESRATLSWIKLAIDLQSQAESKGPVLTLPLN